MEKSEFLKKVYELKGYQHNRQKDYYEALRQLDEKKNHALDVENQNFRKLQEEHNASVKSIRQGYEEQIRVRKDAYKESIFRLEEGINELKMKFFKEHPEENLSIMRS